MRILIKIGSALISKGHKLNNDWLEKKVKEIAALHHEGHDILLVTSGAVAAGMEIEGLETRPKDTLKIQLLSGEGQIKLMKHYKDYFKSEHIIIAQVLLTHHNFDKKNEEKTIRTIIDAYLGQRTIPIINENDLINKEELEYNSSFTDNDILAALVAIKMQVDLLLILTDVDGLHMEDPKNNTNPGLIETVEHIDQSIKQAASKKANPLGLGGMYSKVRAAEMVTARGIDTIVANGKYSIADILSNSVKRTLFKAGAGKETAERV